MAESAPSNQVPNGALLLLDGMSLAFRAYFALPTDLSTEAGVVTNAVHGFTQMVATLVRDHGPLGLGVAFDLPGGTFRDEMVEDYKGGRAEIPEDLPAQFDMIRSIMDAMRIPIVSKVNYEADDVLATLASKARDQKQPVVVVTGDRDCFQLVEDPYIQVLYNRRGVSDYSLYNEEGIFERTGVLPEKYTLLAALRGDPSDNLPGVPGVGEKTAAKLLAQYGDLDGIYAHLSDLTPKLKENLATYEHLARVNAQVMPMVRDLELDVDPNELTLGGWVMEEVEEVFTSLELKATWTRMKKLLEGGKFGSQGSLSSASKKAKAVKSAPSSPAIKVKQDSERPKQIPISVNVNVSKDPSGPGQVVSAIFELMSKASGPIIAEGAFASVPGRSELLGIVLVAGQIGEKGDAAKLQAHGVWIPGDLLAATSVREAIDKAFAKGLFGHHIKELFRSLLEKGYECRGLKMDTAVAAYLIDSASGQYELDHVAEAFGVTSVELGGPGARHLKQKEETSKAAKSLRKGQMEFADKVATDEEALEAMRHGAFLAAGSIFGLIPICQARLYDEGLTKLHDQVEVPLVRVLASMEVVGIAVDRKELRRITSELIITAKECETEIFGLAGHELNVNSTQQLSSLLYDELGLTPGRKTKTGFSTDASTLESLRGVHPIIDAILRYREVEKLRSTYGESLLSEVQPDGRIHASFRQTVARTGRLSSDRPNLHNIPNRKESGQQFRRAFVPAEGYRFFVADYDQVELRVIAHLSGDEGLCQAFLSGTDVHRTVAGEVFGIGADEVNHDQRERAKAVSYGLAYGMEAFGLARRLGISVEEANSFMESYFGAFPKVKAYMHGAVEEARDLGFTRTELGRLRPMADLASQNRQVRMAAERQAMNAGIQGLAADIFKIALVRLDQAFQAAGLKSRLVLQVHDEVIVEAVKSEEPQVEELTIEALEQAASLSVPLVVSVAWGDSWGAAKSG